MTRLRVRATESRQQLSTDGLPDGKRSDHHAIDASCTLYDSRRLCRLPKEMCASLMLNGDLRRLRKRCPEFKMFEHLPRKLRLKNNRNVNVFCGARFWEQGLAKLLYQRSCRSHLLSASERRDAYGPVICSGATAQPPRRSLTLNHRPRMVSNWN